MSPLTPIVNDRVQKIKESGLIKYWTDKAMERVGKLADSKSRPKNIVLGWQELEGHFLIWASCLGICWLSFAAEFAFIYIGRFELKRFAFQLYLQ